jgi:hypothetical protein
MMIKASVDNAVSTANRCSHGETAVGDTETLLRVIINSPKLDLKNKKPLRFNPAAAVEP